MQRTIVLENCKKKSVEIRSKQVVLLRNDAVVHCIPGSSHLMVSEEPQLGQALTGSPATHCGDDH